MSVYEGVYKSLIQGVSQQTPQEREDGQLGAQLNMLSDPVTGLRRRAGVKYFSTISTINPESYIRIVNIDGVQRIIAIDTVSGNLYVFNDFSSTTPAWDVLYSSYFKTIAGKSAIKTTVARGNFFIVNTERVPEIEELTTSPRIDPSKYGYLSVRSSAFNKSFEATITYGSYSETFTVTAGDTAATASPEQMAMRFENAINTTAPYPFTVTRSGTTLALEVVDKNTSGILDVQTSTGDIYVLTSGSSRVVTKTNLLGALPDVLDTYTIAVGNTGNSAYYQYDSTNRTWSEVGVYTQPYKIINEPKYLYFNGAGAPEISNLDMPERPAGDDDNNPLPKFIGYGITGISAYQSRLVLLSGSYVNLSKTTDFNQFMRTSVTEVLDDDAIEISSASLSSAQFEYAVPYNKDLVLIAQDQQAVIPANSTVLTPKTAVIYPSTKLDISLATEPVTVARSMYYTYQRGSEYYQVGEFIPNSYTDSQYYSQNLTDHIPLYATGVCTTLASSTTNNMVVLCSDSTEVLINQFLWRGDERPLMAFHKWELPYKVMYAQFLQEYLVLFMSDDSGNLVIGTMNVQLNQLDDKPVPYLDNYQYVTITGGVGVAPSTLPTGELVGTIYDTVLSRHKEVMVTVEGSVITCPYDGVVVLGTRYESSFQLTPPFIKDDNGKVVAGTRTTIQQLRMTFKDTGRFNVLVQDTMGVAYDNDDDTALTWSEADLGYSWVNSIGSVVIPCRTRLSSTQCSVSTTGTTDLNLVSTEYVLRTTSKRRRL
jgi:hypothetical protein